MSESLKELSDRATPGAWTYPDYGTDFRTGKATIGMTSPAFEGNGRANRAFIVALVNAYRREELHDATAIAEAKAEGRRQGREEAATHLENRADYFNRSPGYRNWDDAARSYRASAKEVQALATAPTETQKPETGEP